jgi:hypothetical protein
VVVAAIGLAVGKAVAVSGPAWARAVATVPAGVAVVAAEGRGSGCEGAGLVLSEGRLLNAGREPFRPAV